MFISGCWKQHNLNVLTVELVGFSVKVKQSITLSLD